MKFEMFVLMVTAAAGIILILSALHTKTENLTRKRKSILADGKGDSCPADNGGFCAVASGI